MRQQCICATLIWACLATGLAAEDWLNTFDVRIGPALVTGADAYSEEVTKTENAETTTTKTEYDTTGDVGTGGSAYFLWLHEVVPRWGVVYGGDLSGREHPSIEDEDVVGIGFINLTGGLFYRATPDVHVELRGFYNLGIRYQASGAALGAFYTHDGPFRWQVGAEVKYTDWEAYGYEDEGYYRNTQEIRWEASGAGPEFLLTFGIRFPYGEEEH